MLSWFYLSSTLVSGGAARARSRARLGRALLPARARLFCVLYPWRCVAVEVGDGLRLLSRWSNPVPPRSLLACTMLLERVYAVWAVSPLIRSPAQVSFRSGSSAHASLGGGHPFRFFSLGSGTCGRRGWVPWGRTGELFWDVGLPSVLSGQLCP